MNREKVIKGLEEISNDKWMKTHADWYASVCSDALALLKEQEAVKPVFECEEPTLRIGQFHCGNCHRSFGISHYRFCPFCGRSVKWE